MIPVLLLIVVGIVQFGLIFWAQNTLTQVVRDTGRWAATQQGRPCSAGGALVVQKADELAKAGVLFGYTNQWAGGAPLPYDVSPAPRSGIELSWPIPTDPPALVSTDCPPDTNQTPWFLNIRMHHEVPLFFPIIGNLIPSCNGSTCTLSSSVQFRMEPAR